jgi:DNA-binding transcriptional ArsR family regulator
MTDKKSYYAIIPASVRYDKDLPPNAKLLYGEITALCNERGYCWAENRYFAELYDVSKTSISKWIRALSEKGYIKTKLLYKDGGKEIDKRYITIVNTPIEEKLNTPITKVDAPIEEKLKDNNTVNNTNNNTFNSDEEEPKRKRFVPPTLEEVQAYCLERKNNVDAQRFIDYYTSNGWYVGKNKMKDWRAAVRTWERNGYSTQKTVGENGIAIKQGKSDLENLF